MASLITISEMISYTVADVIYEEKIEMLNKTGFILLFISIFTFLAACTPQTVTVGEATSVVTVEEVTPVVTVEEVTPVVTVEEVTPVVTVEEVTPVVTVEEVTPVVTEVALISFDDLKIEIGTGWQNAFNASNLCIFTPDGSGFTSRGGGGGVPYGEPHGNFVYSTITDTLASVGAFKAIGTADVYLLILDQFSLSGEPNSSEEIESWQLGDTFIHLVKVDIGSFETATAAAKLENTIAKYKTTSSDRFVINMSWIIQPCHESALESVDKYIASICLTPGEAIEDLEKFKREIGELADRIDTEICQDTTINFLNKDLPMPDVYFQIQTEIMNAFLFNDPELLNRYPPWTTSLVGQSEDPLVQSFICLGASEPPDYCSETMKGDTFSVKPISIGAAGNSPNTGFPFMPALWDEVISVSASAGNQLAPYSNLGEVMMDGEHLAARGTSFAAPKLSVYAAIYLAQEDASNPCSDPPAGKDISPPLGYDAFENMLLKDAAAKYCSSFPTP